MTPSDRYRTQAVRAWLAAGSEELSPRVLENVLRGFLPRTSTDPIGRLPGPSSAPSPPVLRSVLRLSCWWLP